MWCPDCNSWNEDDSKFCMRCGKQLQAQDQPAPYAAAPMTGQAAQANPLAPPPARVTSTEIYSPVPTTPSPAAYPGPVQGTYPQQMTAPFNQRVYATPAVLVGAKTDGFCIGGMVIGICAVLFPLIIGTVLGVIGLILSAVGMGRVKKNEPYSKGFGMGVAGLVLSIIAVALSVTLIAIFGSALWLFVNTI